MKGILRLLQRKNLLFKSFWLSVPSLFFVLLLWQLTWMSSNRRSNLIEFLNHKYAGGIIILTLLLYALITWYSGRLLVYGKHAFSLSLYRHFKKQEFRSGGKRKNAAFYLQLIFSLPRVCAFLVFSLGWIFLLLYAPLNISSPISDSPYIGYLIFLATVFLYSLLYRLAFLVRKKLIEKSHGFYIADEERRKRKNIILVSYVLLICLIIAGNTLIRNNWLLIFSIIILQLFFPFIVIIRRAYSDLTQTWYDHWINNMKRGSTDTRGLNDTLML